MVNSLVKRLSHIVLMCTCFTEPEEAKPDDELKSDGDDSIPVGEAMSDTNSAVTTADSSKQPEESISDVRVPYQSPSPPISEHTPVPVSSPVPVITLDAVSAASSTVDVTSSLSVSTDPPISDQPTSSAVSQGMCSVLIKLYNYHLWLT